MIAHSYLALAAHLGALSPTARVEAEPERLRQWVDRLLSAGFTADRHGVASPEALAAIAEVDLYSGRPHSPRPWPAPAPRPVPVALGRIVEPHP